jgi:hypothetical protein
MGRSLGLPLLLVSLVVGAFLFVSQMHSEGPTSPVVTHAETQAQQYVASTNFSAANEVLQANYAANATYAGTQIDPSYGVTLVRADATSYCLQGGTDTAVEHEDGPNGSPAPGPC